MHNRLDEILARIPVPTFDDAPVAFKGARFSVKRPLIPMRDGKALPRDVVVHPGAVAILPFLDDETIVLIRNKRHAVGLELWEVPAGTLEPGEEPLATAKREIIEETGYAAGKIVPLINFFTTPGFCNEVMYCFAASDLKYVGQSLDDSEEIAVEAVKWTQALEMIRSGKIIDGKTITTLLYYEFVIRADMSR